MRTEQLTEEGFSDEVVRAIDSLTRRQGEPYADFIERVGASRLATQVKLYDLEDNLDALRLQELGPADLDRMQRYHRARRRVLALLGA